MERRERLVAALMVAFGVVSLTLSAKRIETALEFGSPRIVSTEVWFGSG